MFIKFHNQLQIYLPYPSPYFQEIWKKAAVFHPNPGLTMPRTWPGVAEALSVSIVWLMLWTLYSHFRYLDIKMPFGLHQLNIYQQAKELSEKKWSGDLCPRNPPPLPSNRRSQRRCQGRQRHWGTWGETGHSKHASIPSMESISFIGKWQKIHSFLNGLKMLNWEQSLQTKTSWLLTRRQLICKL